jgi:hypothetical protein
LLYVQQMSAHKNKLRPHNQKFSESFLLGALLRRQEDSPTANED